MINFIKKYKEYFLTIGISLLIFVVLFIIKKIYPFGNNSLIYSDMYDQITSYYYYLYDAIKGPDSLLINLNASNGINFFGIISYYLLSPFSLLILLVKRNEIYLFASIIIALKLVTCNITCLYMIKKLFKKINIPLSIILSLTYGFSAYGLNYYLITPWIDVMYMLPLIVIGLKTLLDTDNNKMYVITLILSLYFNFYISLMVIIFIFLLSLPYIKTYLDKKNFGKKILSLGISTVLSIGCALVIILPTYKQISISSRMISTLDTLINSKLGPLTDKITLFLFGPLAFIGILLLLIKFKENKKFLSFYIPSMILLLIPVIFEPVNKILHFGSYACFTYRFGFLTTLLIIIGGAYFFNKYDLRKNIANSSKKIFSLLIMFLFSVVAIVITKFSYLDAQVALDKLTFSNNKILVILLIIMFVSIFVASLIIIILNKGLNKYSLCLVSILSIVHIACTSYIYIGIEFVQDGINNVYNDLILIENHKNSNSYFKYKNNTNTIIYNSSNVTRIPSMDHFSSLTDNSNQKNLKLLGYNSYWTQTYSHGGTLFSDILLANKYIINLGQEIDNYTIKKQYNNLYWHEYNSDISYGYLVNNNVDISKFNNTFDIQNSIYKSITGNNDLFRLEVPTNLYNIYINNNNYHLLDEDNYIEFNINVDNTSKIYLEIYSSLDNMKNTKIFESFNIYVNDDLYLKNYPTRENNGLIDFGTFKNASVNIKIQFLKDCNLKSINVGTMDLDKLNTFTNDYKVDYDIEFINNKININIDHEDNKILFIPINYNDSYTAYNNDEKIEIMNLYNNYIGIKLKPGENNIKLEFVPSYLKLSFIISIICIIMTLVLFNRNLYNKILEINVLQKIASFIYIILYILILLVVYLLPMLGFFVSFIKYIKI